MSDFLTALECLVARHDVLRTAFFWDGLTVPVQVVQREVKLTINRVEISDQVSGLQLMKARGLANQLSMALNLAPLVSLEIARVPDSDKHFIQLQYHHIISDHLGLSIIRKEMALHLQGLAASLPTPARYREFIAHSIHQSEQHDAQGYFKQLLGMLMNRQQCLIY